MTATLFGTPPVRHPARFTADLLPVIRQHLPAGGRVLDPMAGVGTLGASFNNEIEPEWAAQCPGLVTVADARHLPYATATFDAIATSPTYGNRMADHHEARDGSRRHTYRHTLGRRLHEANTGAMQWGPAYREFHEAIWRECHRLLRPGGVLVVNVKDHVRAGRIVPVTAWHAECIEALGFHHVTTHKVPTPGQRHGANGNARLPYESVLVYSKGETQ